MAPAHDYPSLRTIMVGWDNTARRGVDATVFTGSTPAQFEAGLRELVDAVTDSPPDRRLVWVNAWNEWAEGNHLEPGEQHGLGHLEALRRVVMDGRPDLAGADGGPRRQAVR